MTIPLLIVCPARPELLDRAAGLGSRRGPGVTTIVLEGLPGDAAADAARQRCPAARRSQRACATRILASAEGNPLFVDEMVGMLVEDGLLGTEERPAPARGRRRRGQGPADDPGPHGRPGRRPPDARSDRSPSGRRSSAGCSSRTRSSELTPEPARPDVTAALLALIRRELVTPEPAELERGRCLQVPPHPPPRRRLRGPPQDRPGRRSMSGSRTGSSEPPAID